MKLTAFLAALLFVGSIFVVFVQDSNAARFGRGSSFGSKPAMQRTAPAPTQQKPATAQTAPGTQAPKSGFLGGMGGMLGGLLAGSLLGSLLFGGGFSGGGIMDMLLIALLAYLGFKLFTRFRRSTPAPAAAGQGTGTMQYQSANEQQQGGGMWGHLQQGSASTAASVPAGPVVPAGFDTEEFLRGAKMAFTRMQSSWDKRDIEDIALFVSPAVLTEVKAQMADDPTPSTTEILLTNAQLLNVTEEQGEQRAVVFFDVLLREAPQTETTQVKEMWHFVQPLTGGTWKLDGIQQVEG